MTGKHPDRAGQCDVQEGVCQVSRFERAFGALVALLGLTVLVSWHVHYLPGLRLFPNFAAMAYNTALGFLLIGLALSLHDAKRHKLTALLGVIITLLGGLTLIEFAANVNLHIDELFLKCYIHSGHPPWARMAISASICFLLSGLALTLISWRRVGCDMIVAALGSSVVLLGLVGISGYVTGANITYEYGYLTRMALHTAAGFVVVGGVFIASAWRCNRDEQSGWPAWAPMLVAFTGLTATAVVWQTITVHQLALNATLPFALSAPGSRTGLAIRWTEAIIVIEELVSGFGATLLLVVCAVLVQRSKRQVAEIGRINSFLEDEVDERERAEIELMNIEDVLEDRVESRTAELARATLEIEVSAERMKAFVCDVLASVTSGRLRLRDSEDELPEKLFHRVGEPVRLTQTGGLAQLRAIVREAAELADFPMERRYDLLTAAGEAGMNAIVHATCGTAEVRTDSNCKIQVWITDQGSGIEMKNLPRATLERGYTTAGTLGHGIKMILSTADAMWLLTGSTGTVVVIEQNRTAPQAQLTASQWLAGGVR